jgi:hypothetical protein
MEEGYPQSVRTCVHDAMAFHELTTRVLASLSAPRADGNGGGGDARGQLERELRRLQQSRQKLVVQLPELLAAKLLCFEEECLMLSAKNDRVSQHLTGSERAIRRMSIGVSVSVADNLDSEAQLQNLMSELEVHEEFSANYLSDTDWSQFQFWSSEKREERNQMLQKESRWLQSFNSEIVKLLQDQIIELATRIDVLNRGNENLLSHALALVEDLGVRATLQTRMRSSQRSSIVHEQEARLSNEQAAGRRAMHTWQTQNFIEETRQFQSNASTQSHSDLVVPLLALDLASMMSSASDRYQQLMESNATLIKRAQIRKSDLERLRDIPREAHRQGAGLSGHLTRLNDETNVWEPYVLWVGWVYLFCPRWLWVVVDGRW